MLDKFRAAPNPDVIYSGGILSEKHFVPVAQTAKFPGISSDKGSNVGSHPQSRKVSFNNASAPFVPNASNPPNQTESQQKMNVGAQSYQPLAAKSTTMPEDSEMKNEELKEAKEAVKKEAPPAKKTHFKISASAFVPSAQAEPFQPTQPFQPQQTQSRFPAASSNEFTP
mmetsp:Transcript_15408/g.26040  ORF Transcript_15408/g.26040 Transcript_15408/m.26040 type:complete len:169 (+) Transcript_15408:917-1423(+)